LFSSFAEFNRMVYPIRLPFTLANFAAAVCQRGDKMSVFFMRTFCTKNIRRRADTERAGI